MATVDDTYLILCGALESPADALKEYRKVIELDTHPEDGNIHLKYENISIPLAHNIPDIGWDLLEMGAYVYCADQAVSRGGQVLRGHGRDWYRNFELHIPVRCPEIWSSEVVDKALSDTLNFLTDDRWKFHFSKLTRHIPTEPYFDFGEHDPWFSADEVMLFSGGLDSLGGAVESLLKQRKRTVLVSHRPVSIISSRQEHLIKALRQEVQSRDRILHVPVWVNRKGGARSDVNQRARSFLYLTLAAVVALMHRKKEINFYENGIVSVNLTGLEQIVGARATRSTHPQALHGFCRLLSEITGEGFQVNNPFFWKTKSEVVKRICDLGQSRLIADSKSCTHTRIGTEYPNHCGVCSQCIERRIATLYNEVGKDDPEDRYKTYLFTDPFPDRNAKVMVESYIRHNREIEQMNETEFWIQNDKLVGLLPFLPGSTSEKARKIYELHRRNAEQVAEVVRTQIQQHSDEIRRGDIEPGSLLAMLATKSTRQTKTTPFFRPFPTPQGARWEDITIEITSKDSLRISCSDVTKSYHAYEFGFVDRRKVDRYTKQWELLLVFAEQNGVIRWGSSGAKGNLQKTVQALRKTLMSIFGIRDKPISSYSKRTGYQTRFAIRYSWPAVP